MTLHQEKKQSHFSVSDPFPTPCTGSSKVMLSVHRATEVKVEVLSAGKEILSTETHHLLPGLSTLDISLQELPAGSYQLRISLESASIHKTITHHFIPFGNN